MMYMGPGKYNDYPDNDRILLIELLLPLANFLGFRKEQGVHTLHIGYLETMKYLGKFCGYLYTFDLNSFSRNMAFEFNAATCFQKIGFRQDDDFFYKALSSIVGYKIKVLVTPMLKEYRYCMLLESLALCAGIDVVHLYYFGQKKD